MGLEVIAIASIAASLAGAGISAYGSYQQGKAQEEMGKYNAKNAELAAASEADTAAQNSIRMRQQSQRQLSAIRARMASGGVRQDTGSSLDVLGEASSSLELQALDMFRESRAKQTAYQNQAGMEIWQGNQAMSAAKIAAGSSLIKGVGQAGSNAVGFRQSGVF